MKTIPERKLPASRLDRTEVMKARELWRGTTEPRYVEAARVCREAVDVVRQQLDDSNDVVATLNTELAAQAAEGENGQAKTKAAPTECDAIRIKMTPRDEAAVGILEVQVAFEE
jgi:hypothetical protein